MQNIVCFKDFTLPVKYISNLYPLYQNELQCILARIETNLFNQLFKRLNKRAIIFFYFKAHFGIDFEPYPITEKLLYTE